MERRKKAPPWAWWLTGDGGGGSATVWCCYARARKRRTSRTGAPASRRQWRWPRVEVVVLLHIGVVRKGVRWVRCSTRFEDDALVAEAEDGITRWKELSVVGALLLGEVEW
jgi:hypothetical protein